MSKAFIAIDLGASSGRTMLGILDNNKLTIKEINRFWNGPKNNDGVLRWDFSSLLSNIKNGIKLAESEHPISSIAIDTWGVDFGLIDKDGALLEEPVHYRDDRTSGLFEEAFKLVSKKEIYQKTGIQFMELNTLYQCLALKLQNDKSYLESSNLIFSPDLLSYMLTGKIYAEKTIASTSQFYNPSTQSWDIDLLQRLGIRTDILPKLINSGSNVGYYEKIPVIAGAGHDTACAFAAAPIESSTKSAILSSGTCFINKYYDDLYAFTGKPIIICDHQCSFPTHSHKHTMWEQLESQEHVCGAYDEHLIAAASKPYIIGYHRCQYMDRYDENLKMLKQGMVQQNGVPYEPHATLIKEVNKKAKDLFNKNRFIR